MLINQLSWQPSTPQLSIQEKDGRNDEGSECHNSWKGVPGDPSRYQPMRSKTKKELEPPRGKHPSWSSEKLLS